MTRNLLYYGSDDPPPERVTLRAGPLTMTHEQGDLRSIRLGEREVLRRVTVAVRDRHWGTVPAVLSGVEVTADDASFRVTYEARHRAGDIDFAWRGVIEGDASGTVRFRMDGEARATFLRNRIGFCVLHPAACAGAPCLVEHADGTTTRAAFPEWISPDQPVPPFADLRAMAHQVVPGVWAEARFSGDVFEMEDQRNWTDASFKTFCTPLRLPYPVEVKAGTRIAQEVEIKLIGSPPPARRPRAPRVGQVDAVVRVDRAAACPLPRLGLGVASHGRPLSARELERLRVLRLHHLRVDARLGQPNWDAPLRRAAREAAALGVALEVGVFVPERADEELAAFRRLVDELRPPVGAWLVYPSVERFAGGSPTAEAVEAARRHLSDCAPGAWFGAGTDADFIFLQRTAPPTDRLDCVCFSINPQVHAFDHASLVETLEGQAAVVASARRLAGGLPLVVSPVTLKPRRNPYAGGPEPALPPGALPPQVDARQMSLLGAGWTAGSLSRLAQGGVHSITCYETTGWRGVMETAEGSPSPGLFPSLPGAVFPLYHVLAAIGEFAGGDALAVRSSDPRRADGLAVTDGVRTRVLVANLGDTPCRVRVAGAGAAARVLMLDEATAEQAMRAPEDFRAQAGERARGAAGAIDLDLKPCALARIDVPLE